MNMISIKNRQDLIAKALNCCNTHWSTVYDSFRTTVEKSIVADRLPQTWLLMGGAGDAEILGFYQLVENDGLSTRTELSPFISTLFVLPQCRGGSGLGELLLTHAKYEAATMGFEQLYVCTDHIGYYERYGFSEIALDIAVWGKACKIYSCYTPTDVMLQCFDQQRPKSDELHLELAKARWQLSEPNPALLLQRLKHSFPDCWEGKWHQIIAFYQHNVIGAVNFLRCVDDPLRWHIRDLFVVPEYRRQGIARRLIQRGTNEIRRKMSGGEYIHSVIANDNTASQELHRALGFTDLGKVLPFNNLIFNENDTTWELKL